MPIKGLTDQQAALPIIGQLRKGAPKPQRGPGRDLEYFRFTSDDPATVEQFYDNYPKEPKSINVFLPHPTTDENMDSWIELWMAGGLVYRSDGETMVLWQENGKYRTDPKPDPQPPEGDDGKRQDGSSQVGRLSVIVPEMGRLATITVLTTSKHDIINLTRQLRSYESLRGDLRGIPFVLSRRAQMISTPAPGGKRVRREKWLLSIETQPRWTMAQLQAMEKEALPAPEEDEPQYIAAPNVAQLPANVTDPFSEPVVATPDWWEAEAGPEPEPQPEPATKKSERPLDAGTLRTFLEKRFAQQNGKKDDPATKAQLGLLAGKLEECFAGDADARAKRLTVLDHLWQTGDTSKDLTFGQAKVTLDWLLTGNGADETGDYPLHPAAPEEARRLHRAAMVAAG